MAVVPTDLVASATIAAPERGGAHRLHRVASVAELFAHAGISEDLAQIDDLLLARTASRSNLIAAAGAHTVLSGGKRLRAALAVLAARLREQYSLDRVIHAAASAELIHAASLVHDDLVDAADRRRGQVTVHSRWGSDVALMVGDYFFALAAGEMALSPDPRIITFYAQAVQTIVEGELSPVMQVEPLDTAVSQYMFKIGSKTAVLFEAACKAGMVCGAGSEEDVAALGRFGYDLGVAFQIIDDVLDYTGDERSLGKPAGNDLRQGTITLPLIYAVEAGGSDALREVLEYADPDPALVDAVLAEVLRLGGAERARADAEMLIYRAISQLDRFAPSAARRHLIELAHFIVDRST